MKIRARKQLTPEDLERNLQNAINIDDKTLIPVYTEKIMNHVNSSPVQKCNAQFNLAVFLHAQGQLNDAIECYNQILKDFKPIEDPDIKNVISRTDINLAASLLIKVTNQVDQGIDSSDELNNLIFKFEQELKSCDHEGQPIIVGNLAKAYFLKGDKENSEKYLLDVLTLLEENIYNQKLDQIEISKLSGAELEFTIFLNEIMKKYKKSPYRG